MMVRASTPAEASRAELAAPDLARIVEQAGDALIFADREGVIRLWNAAATRLFGFASAETLGSSMNVIIPEKLREAHWRGFDRAMATGQMRLCGAPTVTRGVHKSGARLYVEMTFALVRSGDGAVVGSVAIARDVTARVEREREAASTRGASSPS